MIGGLQFSRGILFPMGSQIYSIGQNDRYFAETKVVENSYSYK